MPTRRKAKTRRPQTSKKKPSAKSHRKRSVIASPPKFVGGRSNLVLKSKVRPSTEPALSGIAGLRTNGVEGVARNDVSHEEPPLPSSYGQDLIIAQPRDPNWIHVYWELKPETLESGKGKLGSQGPQAHLTLRVYELRSASAAEFDAARWFDIGIYHPIGDWTIEVGPPDRAWCVEIGLKTRAGLFFALARSNIARTPPDRPSDRIDEKWGVLRESMPGVWGPSSWTLRASR